MKAGDRVKHKVKPEWGVGKVLADPAGGKVTIFFINAGIKTFALAAPIVTVQDLEGAHPVLDNLKINSAGEASSYKTLAELKSRFLTQFPGGFHGPNYRNTERDYKVAAHTLARKLLTPTRV